MKKDDRGQAQRSHLTFGRLKQDGWNSAQSCLGTAVRSRVNENKQKGPAR